MYADRLMCYIAGGTPPGTRHIHSGCRDRRPPRHAIGWELVGGVYFATKSTTWGGGRAFYDPELAGTAATRAYLITSGQFADIVAQEMHRCPGVDIDLGPVLATGRIELGLGHYETLLHVGEIDGHPALTFTAPWRAEDVPWLAPSAAYLRMLSGGLREAHGWDVQRAAGYLAQLPGARRHWTPAAIAALHQTPDLVAPSSAEPPPAGLKPPAGLNPDRTHGVPTATAPGGHPAAPVSPARAESASPRSRPAGLE
jgi:hypothetical protein